MVRLNVGINPGRMRHVVTLLSPVVGSDATGQVTTYAASNPPVTALAEILYQRGTDMSHDGQTSSVNYIVITARYNPAFAEGCHVLTPGGSELVIRATENVRELNAYMVLTCVGFGTNN